MKIVRFTKLFRDLEASYPLIKLEHRDDVVRVYFEELGLYSEEVFRKAVTEVGKMSPQFFPSLGILKQCFEAAKTEIDNTGRYPNVKFWPPEHDGCKSQGKQTFKSARGLLFAVAPYEGFHVLCRGEFFPRCPWCGITSTPFLNPLIELLISQYPGETKDWNPLHKGNMLCSVCSEMKYPEDFMKTA